jgi:VCBS repeat-containing protein
MRKRVACLLVMAALLLPVLPAVAAVNSWTVSQVLLDGEASLTVNGGQTISAQVTATSSGDGVKWLASAWHVSSTDPSFGGMSGCFDHADATSGTATFTFNIIAPNAVGTFSAYFAVADHKTCASQASAIFKLTDAIIIESAVSTSFASITSGAWNNVDTWAATARGGTITTSSTSPTVTGNGTAFMDGIRPGDRLMQANTTTPIGYVASVQSQTQLTLTANAPSNLTNVGFSARRVPRSTDDVSIGSGHAVTIPDSYTARAATVNLPGGGTQSLAFLGPASKLTVSANVSVNQPAGGGNTLLVVDSGILEVGGNFALTAPATNTNRCVRLRVTSGTVTIEGGLAITNPATNAASGCGTTPFGVTPNLATIDMSGGAGTIHVRGAVTVSNPANTSITLSSHADAVFNYAGTVAQTVVVPAASTWAYGNLWINNVHDSGAALEAAVTGTKVTGNLEVRSGELSNGGHAITLAANKSLVVHDDATLTLIGTTTLPVVSGTGTHTLGAESTVRYGGGNQVVAHADYGHLVLGGSGTKSMPVEPNPLSFVGTTDATGTSTTLPGGWAAGDLALVFAYRDNNTAAPSVPAGWETVFNAVGANTNSHSVGYRVLQSGDTGSGPWTNSTHVQLIVLRNQGLIAPIGGAAFGNGASNLLAYPAVSMTRTDGSSWVVGFGGHRTATNANAVEVSGMTRRAPTTAKLGRHTVANVDTFASRNWSSTVSASSGWRTHAVEVLNRAGTAGALPVRGNLTVSGTAGATMAKGMRVDGSVTIGSSASFGVGGHSLHVGRDFTATGTFSGTGEVVFEGSVDQNVAGSGLSFSALTIARSGGRVVLANDVTVNGVLSLLGGNVATGSNTLAISSTGSVSRSDGHVVGNLRKHVATGSDVTRTFEIGGNTNYTPASVTFASVTTSGTLSAGVTAGTHPQLASSSIDTAKKVSRYWTLTGSGLVYTTYSGSFTFVPGDVDAGADTTAFIVARRSEGAWTDPSVGIRTSTSTQATGLNGFGDFAIGQARTVVAAVDDSYSMHQDGVMAVAAPGVLANDVGSSVASPRPVSGPAHGTLQLNADGSFTYTPNAGFSGTDTFTYRAADGAQTSDPATVTITVQTAALVPGSSWSSSFDAGRYLAVTFPGYLPDGATVEGATFRHSYRSFAGGTTCTYLAVYSGGTPIGSHGSSATPLSCTSGTSFQTDTVSLPEVNAASRANALTVRVYVRNSAGGKSEHRLAELTVDYWLASP